MSHLLSSRSMAPSIATMVGTMDQTFVQYADEMRAQPTRKEIILHFGDMLKELLNRFSKKNNNKRPQRILVYRDGVSEGMYEIVKKFEIDAIKKCQGCGI
ncbi:Piwi domain-containing protein [Endogone sp. FLAS-F59071]|nr:Piwi domain-containing protein [Endogone sp. FLAS-F59071]|eukprot:RUS23362.1 Piwi domain-containing protein [Endogone sp. FLAS-F59071]